MRARSFWSRIVAPTALVAAAIFAPGCTDNVSKYGASPSDETNESEDGKSSGIRDHYLALTAKKDRGGIQMFSLQRLWAPFRIELTGGLLDAKRADVGDATYQLQLFPIVVVCAPRAGGTTVEAKGEGGASTFGTLDVSGAPVVDLAITYDGGTVTVLARKHGDPDYATVGTTVISGLGGVEPRLQVDDLKKRAVIGFDDVRIVQRGVRPGPRTPSQKAADEIQAASDHLVEAYYATDGAGDLVRAKQELTSAIARLDAAGVQLDLAPPSAGVTAAKKQLAKTAKAARAASAAIDKRKKLGTIYLKTRSVLADVSWAARAAQLL